MSIVALQFCKPARDGGTPQRSSNAEESAPRSSHTLHTQAVKYQHFASLKASIPSRALGVRQAAEYAPWSVAVDHIVDVYRYLQLQPSQDCAAKWANFVRDRIVDPTLGNNTQLALNASLPQTQAAQPDVQSRLLRPLLASLSNEFNDTGARLQALAIFQVGSLVHCCLSVSTPAFGLWGF